jgi:aspartate aminotransferase
MIPDYTQFARGVRAETAFDVLATARRLKAQGKRVIELEIGDTPFPTPPIAAEAGIAAIRADQCHYGPSAGLPEFRQAAADFLNGQYGLGLTADNVVAGPGAKPFEQFFCEAFVEPDDGVLVFSPHFPTYLPNIERRGGRAWISPLRQANQFRPNLDDVARFLREDPRPKAIFLNDPHNPTGGVSTHDDLRGIAELVRGRPIAVFSDEPYDHMVWQGRHHTLLAEPDMLDQCVAAYTFSKTFSMSGWRLGFAVSAPRTAALFSTLINTSLSCVPPFVQLAGVAAMREDAAQRTARMETFRVKITSFVAALNRIDGVRCLTPGGTFYVFPSVAPICNRLGITSHGLALYLLEAADDQFGVACLGGECFGQAGGGFLRFSCAEPDEAIAEAVAFLPDAFSRTDRVARFLDGNERYRLREPYSVD